jgi:hypothetical protein
VTNIRLLVCLRFDHCEISAGTIIAVPAGKAHEFMMRGIAEAVEPLTATISPQETRTIRRGRPPKRSMEPNATDDGDLPERGTFH